MLRIFAVAALCLFASLGAAYAQGTTPEILTSGCGTANYTNGVGYLTVDSTGHLCGSSSGSVSPAPYAFTPLTPMQSGLAITSATGLTIPTGSTYAVVCAEGQNVRYSTDGTTTPTASVGMLLLTNQCVSLSGATVLSNFKAIQAAATATLDVSYYK